MRLRLAVVVAFVSGFVALSYEIQWYRAISFVSGGLPAAFGLLLGAYLGGLAVGALACEFYCRDRRSDSVRLASVGAFMFCANVCGFLVLPALAWLTPLELSVGPILVKWGLVFPLVSLAAAMMGAVLPLIAHFGIEPDSRAGARLSYLYLANILGSSAGSLVTGLLFMERWSTATTSLVTACIGVCTAAALGSLGGRFVRSLTRVWLPAAGFVALLVAAVPGWFRNWHARLLFESEWRSADPITAVIENRHGIIVMTEDKTVFGGGAYDGIAEVDLLRDRNGITRAYAVAALHPAPRDVLLIGLSGGAWANVLANLPGVERLTVVEINPGYLRLVRSVPEMGRILDHPRVEIVIDDGRRWLARHPERRFDVVVSNTTFHWRAHATNLLSREFMELVRSRLRPGGVFYFNTTDSWDAYRTAFETFRYGMRVSNFASVSDRPLDFDTLQWRSVMQSALSSVPPNNALSAEEKEQRLIDLMRWPERATEGKDRQN